jgi:hypothetical protein
MMDRQPVSMVLDENSHSASVTFSDGSQATITEAQATAMRQGGQVPVVVSASMT